VKETAGRGGQPPLVRFATLRDSSEEEQRKNAAKAGRRSSIWGLRRECAHRMMHLDNTRQVDRSTTILLLK